MKWLINNAIYNVVIGFFAQLTKAHDLLQVYMPMIHMHMVIQKRLHHEKRVAAESSHIYYA